jgi:hypothetical protein
MMPDEDSRKRLGFLSPVIGSSHNCEPAEALEE